MKDEDFLATARKKFERAAEASEKNRENAKDDIKFARLAEQWSEEDIKARDGRPQLTLSEFNSFIRQVVNEARANRPAIQVVPADNNADPETAEIMSGLIRNIEVASGADIAYDTAVDGAVSGGFGYFRINTAYTSDDTFDQDIVIERVKDPFSVYPDPDSEAADGSDWNCCFVVKSLHKDVFAEKYKDAEAVDWEAQGYTDLSAPWFDDDHVMVAEYWHREEVAGQIVALSDGTVVKVSEYEERAEEYQFLGITPVGEPRTVRSHKVTQDIMSGAEVLETIEWPGKYIPIVPVYGDEIVIDGESHYRSLIHDAKDAGREKNYWRSAAAEAVALAPKIPVVAPEGAFDGEPEKWSRVNDESIAHITYRGGVPPQRLQSFAAGYGEMMQQALAASDDMKAIIGIHSPSLGIRSPAESGIAIRSLQRQADIGTYHFLDNLTRSIRHGGRILIDLIGKVYTTQRIIRVLGEDMKPQQAQIAPGDEHDAMTQQAAERGQEISKIYDLSAGKYDLIVKSGPAYGSQREYARAEMAQIIGQMGPEAAQIIGPLYLRNSDWPGAEDVADKMEAAAQPAGPQGPDPAVMEQVQQQFSMMQQQQAQLEQQLQQVAQENAALKAQYDLKAQELKIKGFEAETRRMEVQAKAQIDSTAVQADVIEAAVRARQASNPFAMEGTQ